MKKIYIYPTYTPSRDKVGNKYIKYFHDAFEHDHNYKVVNRCWQVGVTSIMFNLDANYFVIQWVDLIPFKRFGKIQFFSFLVLACLIGMLGKKIVWVLHNKYAHNGKSRLVDIGMDFLAKRSLVVITHSQSGVDFFNEKYTAYIGKCIYIPHPVYTDVIYEDKPIKWDYIIWGGIDKRKRIVEFLNFVKHSSEMSKTRILLCGQCGNKLYDAMIKECLPSNVTYINSFFSDEELGNYIRESKVILFTYNPDSVLSSGALVYSLNFCKPIIGPNAGAFRDMNGIVSCYEGFNDIPMLSRKEVRRYCETYINENSWEEFPNKVTKAINFV